MPVLEAPTEIKIIVPKGTSITIVEANQELPAESDQLGPSREAVERYWHEFLSDSGKKIFATAALIERQDGPGFVLDRIAAERGIDSDSAKAWHRNTGRTAKRWREETGTPEPIMLDEIEYRWSAEYGGNRTTYRLPPGVGEIILELRTQ